MVGREDFIEGGSRGIGQKTIKAVMKVCVYTTIDTRRRRWSSRSRSRQSGRRQERAVRPS